MTAIRDFIRRSVGLSEGATKEATGQVSPEIAAEREAAPAPVQETAVMQPHPEPPSSGFVGHVDTIGAGAIQGWAVYQPDLKRAITIRLYLDEMLAAEGVAHDPRDDLRQAGFGDGLHGFALPVPKAALFCAEMLHVVAVGEDGEETSVLHRRLRLPLGTGEPILYMDASDLIEFLTNFRELSGIQRVQAGYLLGLGNVSIAGTSCRICTRFRRSSFYFEIPYDRFASLLEAAGDLVGVPTSAWSGHVKAFKDSLVVRAELKPGDIVFTMGAPWVLDDHNETIRSVKMGYGAHYVQVFYDFIPISVPEVVAAPLIPHFARAMAAMSLYADHIFSISRYSQDDLTDTLRRLGRTVPPIGVVPMGGSITDAEVHVASVAPRETLAKLKIAGPFVLCVGTLEPRKNHMLLFQIWRRLIAKHGAANVPRLVLVGRVGWYMEDFIRTLKVTGYLEKTVVHLQGVSNAELATLYDACLFTIFPSFSEGWGLPITESLARGKVCVCSNVTSMPEAGGEHALYIDPFDVGSACDLCEKLIYDDVTLPEAQGRLASFHALTWTEASEDLGRQFAALIPHLHAEPTKAEKTVIELDRTYHFSNLDTGSSDVGASEVFRSFLEQEEALDLLVGRSWFEPDVVCTWACGPNAELSLLLPDGDLEIFINFVVPPACDRTLCTVTFDGATRAAFRCDTGPMMLTIPVFGDRREHRLVVHLEGRRSPSPDKRLLGLGISSLRVLTKDELNGKVRSYQPSGFVHLG